MARLSVKKIINNEEVTVFSMDTTMIIGFMMAGLATPTQEVNKLFTLTYPFFIETKLDSGEIELDSVTEDEDIHT